MNTTALRVLAIGAHPDDCELPTGGTCLLYASHGHVVKYVSLTNGDAGHHQLAGKELSARRAAEYAASCAIGGFAHEMLDISDGYLEANHRNRDRVIRLIRRFQPDLIFLPRPNDYHPDHRAAGQLVQDSAYLLMVPNICPDTPAMAFNPVRKRSRRCCFRFESSQQQVCCRAVVAFVWAAFFFQLHCNWFGFLA